jgi:hypothetical protein
MLPEVRSTLASIALMFALMLAVLGSVITWIPGADAGWYAMTAVIALGGVLAPERRWKLAACLVVGGLLGCAVYEYDRGVKYRGIRSRVEGDKRIAGGAAGVSPCLASPEEWRGDRLVTEPGCSHLFAQAARVGAHPRIPEPTFGENAARIRAGHKRLFR